MTMASTLPIRRLLCCVCGAVTRGRQWHNRDIGFGLCERCADAPKVYASATDNDGSMERLYGRRGEHYCVACSPDKEA